MFNNSSSFLKQWGIPRLRGRDYGLSGRPDRLIWEGGMVTPEEWKSARTLRLWHQSQMGVYFLLIEDQLHVRPTHG